MKIKLTNANDKFLIEKSNGKSSEVATKADIPGLGDGGDDAARVYWGGDWRMPTTEEFQALGAAVNTAWTTNYQSSGIAGLVCTDKTDSSKVLFFPAAGAYGQGIVDGVGNYGVYWSSSLNTDTRYYAYGLYLLNNSNGFAYWNSTNPRYGGRTIRPILDGTNANGHDYVEIGGIKWATMNIGANSVTDYGLHFSWGDAQGYTASQVGSGEGQKYFGWADYKYGSGTSSHSATDMTKYNPTDGKTVLELSTPVEYIHKVAVTGDYNDLENKPFDSYNGHEYVDLGLPSGRLWAKCNIGASSETDYGLYFAWGSNVGYAGDAGHDFSKGQQTPYYIKYNEDDDYAVYSRYVDGETLTLGDDTARNNWGGNWRMPTKEDFQELYNYCNTNGSVTWTTINGVNGRKFTSPNGNYVFFPASGECSGTSCYSFGSHGYYWSSTCYSNDGPGDWAYELFFYSDMVDQSANASRYTGQPVRAVQ